MKIITFHISSLDDRFELNLIKCTYNFLVERIREECDSVLDDVVIVYNHLYPKLEQIFEFDYSIVNSINLMLINYINIDNRSLNSYYQLMKTLITSQRWPQCRNIICDKQVISKTCQTILQTIPEYQVSYNQSVIGTLEFLTSLLQL